MHNHPRRLPVEHRGSRVPNLWKRPKQPGDARDGDTYEVIYRDAMGTQRQKTLRARTLQRAMREAEDYRASVRRGEVVIPTSLTFDQVAEEYFDVSESLVATGERSERTLDLYKQRYETHIRDILGRLRVQAIGPQHVALVFSQQRRRQLSSWTVSGTGTVISSIVSFAISRGYITQNPLSRLSEAEKPKPKTQRQARRLTDSEVRALCESATAAYRPIITALAWTGARVSEALAIRWLDVDFDAKEINICHQLNDRGELKTPKTRAGVRTVPLLAILETSLREHRVHQFERGLSSAENLIYTSTTGAPLNRHNVRNRGIVQAAHKAELGDVTTHDLRRTFISHLIVGLGLDPVRVARIAGHASVSVTLDTYAEEFDRALHRDDLMARIDRAGFGSL